MKSFALGSACVRIGQREPFGNAAGIADRRAVNLDAVNPDGRMELVMVEMGYQQPSNKRER
jgi:hypothetical protein